MHEVRHAAARGLPGRQVHAAHQLFRRELPRPHLCGAVQQRAQRGLAEDPCAGTALPRYNFLKCALMWQMRAHARHRLHLILHACRRAMETAGTGIGL